MPKLEIDPEADLTCQLVKKPNWRPKPHVFNNVKGIKTVGEMVLFICNIFYLFRFSKS